MSVATTGLCLFENLFLVIWTIFDYKQEDEGLTEELAIHYFKPWLGSHSSTQLDIARHSSCRVVRSPHQ